MATSTISHKFKTNVGNGTQFYGAMNFETISPRTGHRYMLQFVIDDDDTISNKMAMYDITDGWRFVWGVLGRSYIDGESITTGSNVSCAGCLTGSQKEVVFSLRVPREIPSGASITIHTMTGSVRGISGYIGTYSNWIGGSGYTLSAWRDDAYTITVKIAFTTALTVTNNTPITWTGKLGFTVNASSS